jgi:hypothetical protein
VNLPAIDMPVLVAIAILGLVARFGGWGRGQWPRHRGPL